MILSEKMAALGAAVTSAAVAGGALELATGVTAIIGLAGTLLVSVAVGAMAFATVRNSASAAHKRIDRLDHERAEEKKELSTKLEKIGDNTAAIEKQISTLVGELKGRDVIS